MSSCLGRFDKVFLLFPFMIIYTHIFKENFFRVFFYGVILFYPVFHRFYKRYVYRFSITTISYFLRMFRIFFISVSLIRRLNVFFFYLIFLYFSTD